MGRANLLIRAKWRNRRETAAEGAARLSKLLRSISEVHPAFQNWCKQSNHKPSFEPFCTMPPDQKALETIIARGVQYKDMPREPWPELGFSVGAWNGIETGAASANFQMTIGAFDTDAAGHNRFELTLADDLTTPNTLISSRVVREIVKSCVANLDPDCVDVAPMAWLVSMDEATCPAGGWMSYVKDLSSYKIDLPKELVTEVVGPGTLVSVTNNIFLEDDAEHRRLSTDLNKALAPVRAVQARPAAPEFVP